MAKKAKTKSPPPRLTATQCVTALRTRYKSTEYALLEQVANGTGFRANRWADALALSLWPSRGIVLHGFEVKVSRSDWTRELRNPRKSEDIQAYCDHWWIVAPERLILPEEVPPTWGLIEVTDKLKTYLASPAPLLEAAPLSRSMLAAVLRRAAEAQDGLLKREYQRGHDDGAKEGAPDIATRLKHAQNDLKRLEEQVRSFEQVSGVKILHQWNHANIGKAVRTLTSAVRHREAVEVLQSEAEVYERQLASVRRELEALGSVQPVEEKANGKA